MSHIRKDRPISETDEKKTQHSTCSVIWQQENMLTATAWADAW